MGDAILWTIELFIPWTSYTLVPTSCKYLQYNILIKYHSCISPRYLLVCCKNFDVKFVMIDSFIKKKKILLTLQDLLHTHLFKIHYPSLMKMGEKKCPVWVSVIVIPVSWTECPRFSLTSNLSTDLHNFRINHLVLWSCLWLE